MSLLSGVSDFFGLDIGTTALRLVQLHGTGPTRALVKYAYVPIDNKLAVSDAGTDQGRLALKVRELITQSGMNTKNVAVGLPSQKVFTTVVDIEHLQKNELDKAIRYQADSLIPTAVDESKIDWAFIGESPKDPGKIEILLSSVTNSFVEQRLDMLESVGLNVIAFEPDNLALARALIAPDSTYPQMVLDISSKSTDLVIIMNGAPRLTRAIPTGTETIVKAAAQNLNVDDKQAAEFVFKFGLNKEKLEGQVYQAIIGTIEILTNEIDKSIKFFQARYTDSKIDRIIVTGGASSLPEFPIHIANLFSLNVEIGNAWRNVSFPAERQNELTAISNQFSVAAGLAERTE
ncbi:MAG TPA: type IV pilus assembly protein PilM [Patescibacteria group bacterium]|jgi:type IV pilus assembly protein PilM|nr:type IV pilus assembly protein PilM [Patescibacteria group bacterium]